MGADPGTAGPGGAGGPSSLRESDRVLVYLAAERTLLSWVRAAIALIVLGFAVDRFGLLLEARAPAALHSTAWSAPVGLGLIASGVVISALSAVRYQRFARRYARHELRAGAGISLGIALCVLLALVGTGLATYLWLASS